MTVFGVPVSTDGTSDLQGADLVWGLCAGKTNPFGAASTTNFLGMKFGMSVGPDVLTYNANSGNPYFWSGRGQVKKVGVTRSAFNGNGLEFHRIATNTGALQRRSAHFVEIAKPGAEKCRRRDVRAGAGTSDC